MRYVTRALLPGEKVEYSTTVHWFVYFKGKDSRWIWPFILFSGFVAGAVLLQPTSIDYLSEALNQTAPAMLLPVTSRTLLLSGATVSAAVTFAFLILPFVNL